MAENIVSSRQLEQRRAEVERTRSMGVKITRVVGVFEVKGVGEASVDTRFPVAFIEPPSISTGWEMGPTSAPEAGNFPTLSIGVLKWVIKKVDEMRLYYVGATWGIVTTGREKQRIHAHWQVEGKAMRNPIVGAEEVV